jgi:Spy/CpxP family protein refolding chaperone
MNRRMWIGLAAVPVVAVLTGAAALTAWGHGPGGHGRHGWMMKRMVSAALDEALDQAGVTAEQRTAIHASRDRAFAALEANAPDRTAHREQVLALFEADQIDPAQVQALRARMEERHQAMHTAISQAIVEIHDTLTPEQRRTVAQFVRSHGPGHWR